MSQREIWNTKDVESALERSGALLTGHFELRSGLHSDRFFQCAMALRYPDIAENLCLALAEKIQASDIPDAEAVIAPALGGVVVGHEMARALGVMSIFAEKDDGKLAMRRFQIEAGTRYLVAEDVVTRGGRVQETIDLVKAGGGLVTAVAVIVDRSAGAAQFGVPLLSLLQMTPQVWEPEACPQCKAGDKAVHPGS